MQTLSENRCYGGTQGVYCHQSEATGTGMTFGLYLPPQAAHRPVPVLWFLAGLTCTHENAMIKAGAQAHAARHGLAVVFPDTSPRGDGVADDPAYDLGQGAGFYVNATEPPWAPHYRMFDYLTDELPKLIGRNFAVNTDAMALTGHSMGGHGALTLAMSRPDLYRSVSAFAPICNPIDSDWGRRQLAAYLGPDQNIWAGHDASRLMAERGFDGPILVDTGTADPNLHLLRTETLAFAMAARAQQGVLRMQKGYDHGYFFVSSFIEDHVAFHAGALS